MSQGINQHGHFALIVGGEKLRQSSGAEMKQQKQQKQQKQLLQDLQIGDHRLMRLKDPDPCPRDALSVSITLIVQNVQTATVTGTKARYTITRTTRARGKQRLSRQSRGLVGAAQGRHFFARLSSSPAGRTLRHMIEPGRRLSKFCATSIMGNGNSFVSLRGCVLLWERRRQCYRQETLVHATGSQFPSCRRRCFFPMIVRLFDSSRSQGSVLSGPGTAHQTLLLRGTLNNLSFLLSSPPNLSAGWFRLNRFDIFCCDSLFPT
ncbi:hypothetical protein QBC44DRAFT_403696 [Cladorrhinum sp. PSN332]|nr:hypothetical protein QBC44DRAFT_403696 [Cladorrhinum sp. PSN332]